MKLAQYEFAELSNPLRSQYADFKTTEITDFNDFITKMNRSAWERILQDTKLKNLMTKKVKASFTEKFKHQHSMAFTKDNML